MAKRQTVYPLISFMLAYLALFVMFGHLDALTSFESKTTTFVGFNMTHGDVYFFCLAAIVILIYLSILAAYKLAQSKSMSFKEFAIFSAVATIILPVSVWGLAWIRWFNLKTTGNLIYGRWVVLR